MIKLIYYVYKTLWFILKSSDIQSRPRQTSDFFIDIVTLDQRTEELYQKSNARFTFSLETGRTKRTISFSSRQSLANRLRQWPSTWIGEMAILFGRNMKMLSEIMVLLVLLLGKALS